MAVLLNCNTSETPIYGFQGSDDLEPVQKAGFCAACQ